MGGGEMQGFGWHHIRRAILTLCVAVAAAGWLYVIYNERRSHDPTEIVKKHFVFYPDYSHGSWHEGQCADARKEKCREVTYTVPVKGCGAVTFDWRVFSDDDGDATWTYQGPSPKVNESKYPLYAVLNEDSRFIDSPALRTALPEVCQVK
jgi:hypothetical protein